jgi:uncharacterized protein (DUF983 family)
MVKYCFSCGKPLEMDNAEICPNCGVRLKKPPNQDSCGCSSIYAILFILIGIILLAASVYNSPFKGIELWATAFIGLAFLGLGIYFAAKSLGWTY